MAVHYQYTFKALTRGTDLSLTVKVYDSSGASAVTLISAAAPFETEEDDSEDMFTTMRTQSGYLRIADTNGIWSGIIPTKDTDRYVQLVNGSTILWQGFMQAQTFGNELYRATQEIELPVQCLLSVLSTQRPTTSDAQPRNFAYIINMCVGYIESVCLACGFGDPITNIYIQGGSHATEWLMKKVDWQNFFDSDETEDMTAKYTYRDMLEDVCRFWGWTVRIYRQSLVFTMVDDAYEPTFLNLTRADLTTLAGGTDPEADTVSYTTKAFAGTGFASVQNDEYIVRGANKAVVKSDANDQDILFEVFPPSVKSAVDNNLTYAWYGKESSTLVGYFSTPTFMHFGQTGHYPSKILQGDAESGNGFARRQYYVSEETDSAEKVDVIVLHEYSESTPQVQIQTKKQMNFSQGSLKLNANIFHEFSHEGSMWIWFRIGIGDTRENAKWWYMDDSKNYSWSQSNSNLLRVWVADGKLLGSFTWFVVPAFGPNRSAQYPAFPLEDGLSGHIFVDFYGATNIVYNTAEEIEIGNFAIEYSRETVYIDSSDRSRTLEDKRESSREYTSSNNSTADNEWNANLIFASDQKMKYGYGLVMNTDGSYMTTATYGGGSTIPEQHLADRVASYWNSAKRKLTLTLCSAATIDGIAVRDLSPLHKVTYGGLTYYPIAIDHRWRDDESIITLMQV